MRMSQCSFDLINKGKDNNHTHTHRGKIKPIKNIAGQLSNSKSQTSIIQHAWAYKLFFSFQIQNWSLKPRTIMTSKQNSRTAEQLINNRNVVEKDRVNTALVLSGYHQKEKHGITLRHLKSKLNANKTYKTLFKVQGRNQF